MWSETMPVGREQFRVLVAAEVLPTDCVVDCAQKVFRLSPDTPVGEVRAALREAVKAAEKALAAACGRAPAGEKPLLRIGAYVELFAHGLTLNGAALRAIVLPAGQAAPACDVDVEQGVLWLSPGHSPEEASWRTADAIASAYRKMGLAGPRANPMVTCRHCGRRFCGSGLFAHHLSEAHAMGGADSREHYDCDDPCSGAGRDQLQGWALGLLQAAGSGGQGERR